MKPSKIIHSETLMDGGATSPTIKLYQRASGRCRLYWECYDQDGYHSETMAVFVCRDWTTARTRARELVEEPSQFAHEVL